MFSRHSNPIKFADCRRLDGEQRVMPNLAMSPSMMEDLHDSGKTISTQSAESMYYEGDSDVHFDLPLDLQRGVDIADLWQAQKDARSNVSKAQAKAMQSKQS